MQERSKKNNQDEVLITPLCDKCGNANVWEPFDSAQGGSGAEPKDPKKGEWVCPHCQGEIDFLGDDDE